MASDPGLDLLREDVGVAAVMPGRLANAQALQVPGEGGLGHRVSLPAQELGQTLLAAHRPRPRSCWIAAKRGLRVPPVPAAVRGPSHGIFIQHDCIDIRSSASRGKPPPFLACGCPVQWRPGVAAVKICVFCSSSDAVDGPTSPRRRSMGALIGAEGMRWCSAAAGWG